MTLEELRERTTISPRELAATLQLGEQKTYALLRQGAFPFAKRLGRTWLISVPALLGWLGAAPAGHQVPSRTEDLQSVDQVEDCVSS